MNKVHRYAIAVLAALMVVAAEEVASYDLYPVTIEKDGRGRITADSVSRLEHAIEELEEHGTLRIWVEGKMDYQHLPPTDPSYPRQEQRKRALLERIVSSLASVMRDVYPAAEYPSVGPYVAVSANLQGLQRLVDDRDVQAFYVLVPSY